MYVAEELKRSKAVTAARAHASELEAAVAKSDAEAAAGAFQQLKDNVNGMLLELRYVRPTASIVEAHYRHRFKLLRAAELLSCDCIPWTALTPLALCIKSWLMENMCLSLSRKLLWPASHDP